MSTNSLSVKDIKRSWQLVDAKEAILGRMATQIATYLMGKHKPNTVSYLDNGDFVVVTNAALVKVTGKKLAQKVYFRHSGYPGGDKSETLSDLQKRRPEDVIKYAVAGMLPKTKLGKDMIKKLYIYKDENHPHQAKITGGVS